MDRPSFEGLDRRGVIRLVGTLGAATTAGCLESSDDGRQSTPTTGDERTEGATLTVRVETPNGDPITEVVVFVTIGSTPRWVPDVDGKTPGANGIVRFTLENGEYTVRTRSQEYTNADEPVTVDGDTEVTITLERGNGKIAYD